MQIPYTSITLVSLLKASLKIKELKITKTKIITKSTKAVDKNNFFLTDLIIFPHSLKILFLILFSYVYSLNLYPIPLIVSICFPFLPSLCLTFFIWLSIVLESP